MDTDNFLVNTYQIILRHVPENVGPLHVLSFVDTYGRFGETLDQFFVRRVYGDIRFLGKYLPNYTASCPSKYIIYI